jgi:myosin-18
LQPKSHENGTNGDIESQRGERVWLVHRGGFCAALRVTNANGNGHAEPGKVLIELEHNGEQMYVDDDDVEKANPGELDLVEDICQLKHLNEASVLNCIRQRYASNLIHTRAGPTLIVVNPMVPLSLYSEKVRCQSCANKSFEYLLFK